MWAVIYFHFFPSFSFTTFQSDLKGRSKLKNVSWTLKKRVSLFYVVSVWLAHFHTSIEPAYARASTYSINLWKKKELFNKSEPPADSLIRFQLCFMIRFPQFCNDFFSKCCTRGDFSKIKVYKVKENNVEIVEIEEWKRVSFYKILDRIE